eukprot:CAMPEP_0185611918 /NCGR_PEP_ID=MMETSP0436-20130131/18146_1 /TAXON_ID=626734 ORGANISM="Favella taraikaensis, Strain Fe Narragansett Bay" /NCGR_SAMPLE_ID=MMETSP0436 /ASSEMBLY_ACC=CAM_ASM_000390 /LENGTH=50 /DNA_ID=CAMNT_0028244985 /DNA_START=460 /DNA_END=609 /DNA_ORIENTATION=+
MQVSAKSKEGVQEASTWLYENIPAIVMQQKSSLTSSSSKTKSAQEFSDLV